MTRIGIPVKKFSKRLGNDPAALVQKWPFADLAPTSEIATDIGYGWRATSGIAVGRVAFVHDTTVTFELNENAYRTAVGNKIHLLFDDPELSRPWRQLVGTALAAEVSVESTSDFSTNFRPKRILAVEPPMTHPSYKDAVRLTPRTGYVHGVVSSAVTTYDEHIPATIQLSTPGSDTPITLNYLTVPHISTPDGLHRDDIYQGDIVRAGVASRSEIRQDLYIANGVVHHLGRIAV